jgi:hypothetical protein
MTEESTNTNLLDLYLLKMQYLNIQDERSTLSIPSNYVGVFTNSTSIIRKRRGDGRCCNKKKAL